MPQAMSGVIAAIGTPLVNPKPVESLLGGLLETRERVEFVILQSKKVLQNKKNTPLNQLNPLIFLS
jgi:hypothetical protein